MKKLAILLLAGATIGFASCGDNTNTSTNEQIDSMATYRTDTMSAALKAQNDSLIAAMAQMRADSAMRAEAAAGKPVSTTRTTTAKTTKPTITKPKTETQKVNDLFNNNKTDAQKTKEVKQEEKKVNDLFNK